MPPPRRPLRREDGQGAGPAGGEAVEHLCRPRGGRADRGGPAVKPLRVRSMFDVASIRGDFPILQRQVHGKPLVYLDNAATTQKPRAVIEALVAFYEQHHANLHRAIPALGEEATGAYEDT